MYIDPPSIIFLSLEGVVVDILEEFFSNNFLYPPIVSVTGSVLSHPFFMNKQSSIENSLHDFIEIP